MSLPLSSETPIRFTLRITNRLATARTVVLEPWTGEYRLPPGVPLDIVVEGRPSTPLEVEVEGDRIVIYSFDTAGALLTAYRDGRELRSEHDAPAG
jgi:hypothetical protein